MDLEPLRQEVRGWLIVRTFHYWKTERAVRATVCCASTSRRTISEASGPSSSSVTDDSFVNSRYAPGAGCDLDPVPVFDTNVDEWLCALSWPQPMFGSDERPRWLVVRSPESALL